MKALFIKDIRILERSMGIFFGLMILYIAIGMLQEDFGYFQTFPPFFFAMMPRTVLSYEERSHWERYEMTLPVSRRQVVASKYLLGFVLVLAGCVLSWLANVPLAGLIFHRSVDPWMYAQYLLVPLIMGTLYMDIDLPVLFCLGVEKGRLFSIFLLVIMLLGTSSLTAVLIQLAERFTAAITFLARSAFLLPLLGLTVIVVPTALSLTLACIFYQRRDL